MKVKYLYETKPFLLQKGKIYDVQSIEKGWYRIVDESGDDYLYPPELFEIVKDDSMGKSELIENCFYGVNLSGGEIDLNPSHLFDCFIIVNQTTDDDYIIRQLTQLILFGCSQFHFFGRESFHWYKCSIRAHQMLYPGKANNKPLLIVDWDSEVDFLLEICEAVRCRGLVPCDIYLIYDDLTMYKKAIRTIHRMNRLRGDLYVHVGSYKEIINDDDSESVLDNISDEEIPEKQAVLSYMKSIRPDAIAPAIPIDCITGERMNIDLYSYHDGIYSWRSDTIYYFEKYNLQLPDDFISFAIGRRKVRKHEKLL